MSVIGDSSIAANLSCVEQGSPKISPVALFSTVITSEHFHRKNGPYTGLPAISV